MRGPGAPRERGTHHPASPAKPGTQHFALKGGLPPSSGPGIRSPLPGHPTPPTPRCHLLRRFRVEASLSKFAKCLFIPVRWGLGEAVNVEMAPAQGPERRFLGLPNGAVAADPGRLEALHRAQEPQPSPSNPPPEAAERPYLLFLLPGTHSEVNLSPYSSGRQ